VHDIGGDKARKVAEGAVIEAQDVVCVEGAEIDSVRCGHDQTLHETDFTVRIVSNRR
jgi:hypothetical protein